MESKVILPTLTKYNWTTEFKGAFTDYALRFGAAGKIIAEGVDVHLNAPNFDMLIANARVYPESDIGWKRFQHDCNLHLKLKEDKMKLMSSLKECMDREIKSKVERSPSRI